MQSSIDKSSIKICGSEFVHIESVNVDYNSFDIKIKKRETIRFYTFNSLMFPGESKRSGTEEYNFEGPKVGLYHDTVDPREGPYVNHFINKLFMSVTYNDLSASFIIKGEANLSKSYLGSLYKGETNGIWYFEAKFIHKFKTKL